MIENFIKKTIAPKGFCLQQHHTISKYLVFKIFSYEEAFFSDNVISSNSYGHVCTATRATAAK